MEDSVKGPTESPRISQHSILLMGLRRGLNWGPIMPSDSRAANMGFFAGWPYRLELPIQKTFPQKLCLHAEFSGRLSLFFCCFVQINSAYLCTCTEKTSISFQIEWDMILVTVFISSLNQMEFHLVQKIERITVTTIISYSV